MRQVTPMTIKVDSWDVYHGKLLTDEKFTARKEEIDEFKEFLRTINTISVLPPNSTVFFDKSVIFPRKKFKKSSPTNKMVYDVQKADVVVIDQKSLFKEFNHYYYGKYYPCKEGHYTHSTTCPTIQGAVAEQFAHFYHQNPENHLKRMNFIYSLEGKQMIDVKDISIASNETLNKESFQRLNKMMEGSDDAMRNMAMNLLTAYDYEKEKYRIAALLSLNWLKWQRGTKKVNIEVKSMLRKIELDFGDFSYGGFNSSTLKFWLDFSLQHKDDEVISEAFNTWIKNMIGVYPTIKVERI